MTQFPADTRPTFTPTPTVPGPNNTSIGLSGSAAIYNEAYGESYFGNGYSGAVYFQPDGQSSTTISLPANTSAFSFYGLTNDFGTYTMTATTDDGTTSGPIATTTQNGGKAHGFAFYADSGYSISSITVTNTSGDDGVVGQFGISGVPTQQTITFPQPTSPITYAPNETVTLGATASSGLTVSYSVPDSAPCTVSGSTLTITGAGQCVVTASQAGNGTYAAATPVPRTITINKANQTITFPTLNNITYGATPPTPVATASSGLNVSYTSLTTSVCTISGTTITVLNKGTCTIAANQTGNANYNAATQVTQSFTITGRTATLSKVTGALAAGYKVSVTDSATGKPLTTGQVSFYGAPGYFCTAPVINGVATCTVPASQRGKLFIGQLTKGFGVTAYFTATGYNDTESTNGLPGAPAVD